MKTLKTVFLTFLLSSTLHLISCIEDPVPSFDVEDVMGMIPIYEKDLSVSVSEPVAINLLGRIIYYQDLILATEVGAGIHVLDNSDRENPETLYFIQAPENNDFAIQNGILYMDVGPDLVGYRITDSGLTELSRAVGVFFPRNPSQDFPPQDNVYFQCPEPENGRIVAWKLGRIAQPDCFKNREQ